ncbi:MAG: hypothetical protein OEZ68_00050 [Gammaproteobacteria bacterium]|nr:hypothetical protein [Gammaproteobacteria bacterium]MDH5799176.1 hypothetical protein [Gammaproteobacteria bacterium]
MSQQILETQHRYSGSGLTHCTGATLLSSVLLLGTLLQGCGTAGTRQAESPKNEVAVLRYEVREPGRDKAYVSEILVSKTRMVMWEPGNAKDFLMFDRQSQTIYSVTSDDQTVFVIKAKPVAGEPPMALENVEVSQPSSAMPKIQNMPATHYRYDVNGKHCYDVVSLPENFLPDVRQALVEYRTVLAGEHAAGLANSPKDQLQACDLSINIFHPVKHLQHGVPIREWDRKGKQRFMVDFREKWLADMSRFDLPQGYQHYSIY